MGSVSVVWRGGRRTQAGPAAGIVCQLLALTQLHNTELTELSLIDGKDCSPFSLTKLKKKIICNGNGR